MDSEEQTVTEHGSQRESRRDVIQFDQDNEQNPGLTGKWNKWVIMAAAFSVTFVGVGYPNTFGVFQEHYQTVLFPDIPSSEIILIGSVASSLYLILGVFTGRFADMFGYQVALIIGGVLMVGGMFAASISQEFYQFFLSQGVMFGLGISFSYYPAVTISRQYFGTHQLGLANGIVLSGGALGGCFLPYAVRELLANKGLPQTFRVLGFVAAGVLAPSIFLLKPRTAPSRGGRLIDFTLLRDARFIVMLVAGTIAMTGFLPRYFLITPYAIQNGVSPSYAAWLLGMMTGLSIIGRVGIGMLADRYGKMKALIASFVLCGIGHLVFWLPSVMVEKTGAVNGLLTAFVIYTGLFGSGFVSLFPVVVSHLFGSRALASKLGLLNSVMGLGVLAGPSAIYGIVSSNQDWTGGVLATGLLMFVGGIGLTGTYYWKE